MPGLTTGPTQADTQDPNPFLITNPPPTLVATPLALFPSLPRPHLSPPPTMSLRIQRSAATIGRRCYASSSSLDAYSKLNTRQWKGTSVDGTPVKNFIGGKFVPSKATKHYDVHNPVSVLAYNLTGHSAKP
jgi:hypothetical protein